jgi:hypothetical protein
MNSLTEYQVGGKIVTLFMILSFLFAVGLYRKVYSLTGEIYDLQQQQGEGMSEIR